LLFFCFFFFFFLCCLLFFFFSVSVRVLTIFEGFFFLFPCFCISLLFPLCTCFLVFCSFFFCIAFFLLPFSLYVFLCNVSLLYRPVCILVLCVCEFYILIVLLRLRLPCCPPARRLFRPTWLPRFLPVLGRMRILDIFLFNPLCPRFPFLAGFPTSVIALFFFYSTSHFFIQAW